MKNILKLTPLAAVCLLTSCMGTIHEGTVVEKRQRHVEAGYDRLGDAFVLEIRTEDAEGNSRVKDVLVSQKQWAAYKVGDQYPAQPKLAVEKAEPAPKREKKVAKEKVIQPKKAAPTATPQPEPTATATPKPKPSPTATPVPQPAPKATATPAATPTPVIAPSPKPVASPLARPVVIATPSPKPVASPTAKPAAVASPTAKPVASPSPKPVATPSPTAKPQPTPTPKHVTPLLPAQEKAAFDKAKATALEDSRVRALKDKIHSARTDDEQRKASVEYQHALYEKMRQVAPPQLAPKIEKAESDAVKSAGGQ